MQEYQGLQVPPQPPPQPLPAPAPAHTWGWRSRVGSTSGSAAVGGRGWGLGGDAPGVSSREWVSGRLGGSGSTWQSLSTTGCGGFGKREGRQAALGGGEHRGESPSPGHRPAAALGSRPRPHYLLGLKAP